jgi:hypothetical protein
VNSEKDATIAGHRNSMTLDCAWRAVAVNGAVGAPARAAQRVALLWKAARVLSTIVT